MKKIIGIVLAIILLLPITVKADAIVLKGITNNSKVVVGGEEEIHIPLNYNIDYKLEITYDTNYLEISNNQVSYNKPTSTIIENGERKTVNNTFNASVSEGKVIVNVKVAQDQAVADSELFTPELNLKFKALKAGTSAISIGGERIFNEYKVNVVLEEAKCSTPAGQSQQMTTAEHTAPVAPEGQTEPVDSEKSETIIPIKDEKRDKNRDLLFYISIGTNAVLFIALIATIVVKRKNKTVEKVENN